MNICACVKQSTSSPVCPLQDGVSIELIAFILLLCIPMGLECPSTQLIHDRAGKRYRGKTCKGNRYLRRVLVPWAWGARKTPTFLGRTFRRREVRIGKKKAALAIAHKILVIVYHLLTLGTSYEEVRYEQYNPRQEARERTRALKALERLGSTVTLERAA